MKEKTTTTQIVFGMLLVLAVLTYLATTAYRILAADEVKEPVQHTRVIEQCNRINLLSCIACHDFPAYVIDVQPEIWEE